MCSNFGESFLLLSFYLRGIETSTYFSLFRDDHGHVCESFGGTFQQISDLSWQEILFIILEQKYWFVLFVHLNHRNSGFAVRGPAGPLM